MTVTDENTLAFIFPILSKYPTSKCLSKNFFNIVHTLGFKGMGKDKVIILTQIKV